jgi:hypothetical protein
VGRCHGIVFGFDLNRFGARITGMRKQLSTDLQSALNAGAINQSEYDKLRAIILKRPG